MDVDNNYDEPNIEHDKNDEDAGDDVDHHDNDDDEEDSDDDDDEDGGKSVMMLAVIIQKLRQGYCLHVTLEKVTKQVTLFP